MSNDVLIEYRDGRQYAVASPAVATKHHPDAKIVRYVDGRPYEEPKASTPKPHKAANGRATARTSAADRDAAAATSGGAESSDGAHEG